jgi:hypothetical protein
VESTFAEASERADRELPGIFEHRFEPHSRDSVEGDEDGAPSGGNRRRDGTRLGSRSASEKRRDGDDRETPKETSAASCVQQSSGIVAGVNAESLNSCHA